MFNFSIVFGRVLHSEPVFISVINKNLCVYGFAVLFVILKYRSLKYNRHQANVSVSKFVNMADCIF